MKPLVCIYCEGGDTKIAVINKEKDKLKLIKAGSFEVLQNPLDLEEGISTLKIEGEELDFDNIEKATATPQKLGVSSHTVIAAFLKDVQLNKHFFIPALTEPAVYYHIFEGKKQTKSNKLTQEIIEDIRETKNVYVDPDNLSYTELSDNSLLTVFIQGDVGCVKLIDSIARHNGKRYYKIPTIKSAEVSLAYYVAKRKKFFPDDYSLIVYIGKEYSKLIFLHGRKLKHIGATLDIGTINLHTYDVYFSKILLEMENGGITSLDNIVVCGEDDSENLVLSFYGTFPEANVSRLEFDDVDVSQLDPEAKEIISSFSAPIAVATDYYDEQEKAHKGVNLLPRYIRENQKIFQFSWHGYVILILLFAAAFLITQKVLENNKEINQLETEIAQQSVLLRQNEAMLGKIAELESKISGFDQTQAILDSVSVGAEVWTNVLSDISGFFAPRKNLWLTKLQKDQDDNVLLEGYAVSKFVLTDFAYSIQGAKLKNIMYEELREQNIYKFTLTFSLNNYPKKL